jgi:Type II CAAX prenyl endopeptidase Rce1-like
MRCMTSRLQRAVSRLLASSPSYVEITALLATALAARVLFFACLLESQPTSLRGVCPICQHPGLCLCRSRPALCLFRLGSPAPRHLLVICAHRGTCRRGSCDHDPPCQHTPLGQTAPATLLYGITIGPIIEEILFRGAAFSVIYVTAASIKGFLRLRLAIAIVLSSLLFALAHTRTMGISWLVFFGMGTLYALLRWRSNSTAAAALMHAAYNAVIALAMLHA